MGAKLSEKLMSRKFWLALLACLYFGFVGAHAQLAQVVIAYLAVQAGADAFVAYTESRADV
jgi:hypothetical protein